jgi:hypothetical protein
MATPTPENLIGALAQWISDRLGAPAIDQIAALLSIYPAYQHPSKAPLDQLDAQLFLQTVSAACQDLGVMDVVSTLMAAVPCTEAALTGVLPPQFTLSGHQPAMEIGG